MVTNSKFGSGDILRNTNKKGFTLIELLAVIVILAVIALITTPIILNMINNAKKSAAIYSAYGYIEAIEYNNTMAQVHNTKYTKIESGEVSTINSLVKVKGTKPTSGNVTIEKGRVTEATLVINGYIVKYDGKKATIDGEKVIYKEEMLNGTDPVLSENLIPVTIENNGTVKKADIYSDWYSYANKKWANAVILSDETKTYEVGETIPEDNIESYFVWIPRYKYQIFDLGNYATYAGTAQPDESNVKEIKIVFENKNTAVSNGDEVGEYLSHPAFQAFDTNGLWVGKFETTGTIDALTVKPGITSLRSQTVSTMFTKAYNYNRSLDSHMMKNTEWGAVAYLSHSKYGINKEININNNSGYLTGYSAVATTDQTDYPGTYGTDSSVTLAYNTEIGYKASTTGNITGIYDMSGGAWEYMASYIDSELGNSGFTSDPVTTYGKEYFDKYSNTSTVTSYNNRILGDATGEMGPFYYYKDGDGNTRYHNSWYADDSFFVDSGYPWFHRGGLYNSGVIASQFYFARFKGGTDSGVGFRLVLAN